MSRRRNPVNRIILFAIGLASAAIWLLSSLWLQDNRHAGDGGDVITLHCAAGLSKPVQRIAEAYEKETGHRINLQFGGSGTLLSGLQVSQQGDLFLAADESYTTQGREKGLISEVLSVATLTPVIAVKKGNPKGIKGLADLTREDVRLSLGDPKAAAIGQLSKTIFEEAGLWDKIEEAIQNRGLFGATVNGLATDLSAGPIDASIIWSAVADQFEKVEALPLDLGKQHTRLVTLGVLTAAKNPAAALHFARYITAKDKGLPIFSEEGFTPVPGDAWAETPELTLFSGGVNRVAIEDTVREFEEREGVRVTTVYNGCGILVSQMRSGARPDAYLACDTSYMNDVQSLFTPSQLVSSTDMVIIAAPGNPKQIKTLADLGKAGVRVAITNPEYSALGGLTHNLLRATNLFDPVIANVTFGDAPTADAVVTRVRTAREDAGIVYRANTIGLGGDLEIIEIDDPRATAAQPVAIGLETPYPQLMARLVAAITTEASGERYRKAGFEFIFGKQ
jgi:molybdate transport system substrate-binding protein